MELLNYILENAPAYIVQQGVKDFNVKSIGYRMKNQLISEFPEYRGNVLQFGIALSYQFKEFKTDEILAQENNRRILEIQRMLRVYNKYHEKYKQLVDEHDLLVMVNNKLNEPITNFLKLYKKVQKAKGKKLSIVKKKEYKFQKPV